jgi:hypothetical protein
MHVKIENICSIILSNQMCNMCAGYIYDLLIHPLSAKSHLLQYIHMPSLKRNADTIVYALVKAVALFPNDEFIFDINDNEYPDLQKAIENKDKALLENIISIILWTRFQEEYPLIVKELEHMVSICIDGSVARKTRDPEKIIREFLMYKLHSVLSVISEVHASHMQKNIVDNGKSPGPVPKWKIDELRRAAGLYVEPIPTIPTIITIGAYVSSTSQFIYDELYS